MRDAQYFRDQAKLCLRLASVMSDPRAAEKFRVSAASYVTQAHAAERHGALPAGRKTKLQSKHH